MGLESELIPELMILISFNNGFLNILGTYSTYPTLPYPTLPFSSSCFPIRLSSEPQTVNSRDLDDEIPYNTTDLLYCILISYCSKIIMKYIFQSSSSLSLQDSPRFKSHFFSPFSFLAFSLVPLSNTHSSLSMGRLDVLPYLRFSWIGNSQNFKPYLLYYQIAMISAS